MALDMATSFFFFVFAHYKGRFFLKVFSLIRQMVAAVIAEMAVFVGRSACCYPICQTFAGEVALRLW